ncbi:beta-lactamase family protein [Fonsecaea pedrosoi]|nr:beta-lactamase family protein [Fonsecaea pedrosoi]
MYLTLQTLLLISASARGVLGDFLGPTYPAPTDLASNGSRVSAAWTNLTSTLNGFIRNPSTNLTSPAGLKNITFSLGMFSIHDASAARSLQFHHTSEEIANSTTGLKKVDGNSIYRVASISKIFTTFAGMLNLNDSDWDRPITDFIPTFAAYAAAHPAENDSTLTVAWDKVTLAALASQIAGNPRDVTPFDPGDYLFLVGANALLNTFGLPPLNESDPLAAPPCLISALAGNRTCSNNEYAIGAAGRPPLFQPWTSPAYTDYGYMLLGAAIANITGTSIHDVYRESIFSPLGMASSYSQVPNASEYSQYVIPGNVTTAALTDGEALDVTVPSGGIFSTTNDLARLGTAILNGTLLDLDQTRKWMKPVTHTALLEYSIGRPWEIYRYTHPETGHVTDIYTKLGDSGYFGGYIALIPDFDAGFSIIGASSLPERSLLTASIADLVTEKMLPALTAEAQAEARQGFVGTYTSDDENLNSTLTLAINPQGKPGLVISNFVSNGTDVLASGLLGDSPVRLLHSISDRANGRVAFRTSSFHVTSGGLFSRQYNANIDWLAGDSPTYGGIGLGLFVFDLDASGDAVAVSPAAWRTRLVKTN